MTKSGYKLTEIGEIPEEWEVDELGDLVEILDSKRVPLSEMNRQNMKGRYPYCGANGIIDYIDSYIFDEETVLLAEDGGSYGKYHNSAYLMQGKYWVNNHAHVIKGITGKSVNSFILYWLNYCNLNIYVSGSTRAKLNQEKLNVIPVPKVPIREQKKVAEILSTTDDAIQKVNEQIALTEQLKKGLMQELLTRGIGHTRFRETEIGEIPEDWTLRQLGDKDVSEIVMGQSPPSSSYNTSGEGLPFLQGNADFGVLYPTPRVYCTKPLKISEPGDILMSVRAPVGEMNVSPFKCIIGRGLAAVRNVRGNTYGKYLYYYLKNGTDRLKASSTGSTFKAVGRNPMMKFKIALPPLPEQQEIVEIFSRIEDKLNLFNKKRRNLEMIKRGLMECLLTGKIRVKI